MTIHVKVSGKWIADNDLDPTVYQGVDLTAKFAKEIADFGGDEWAWIKNRIQNANYDGLHIADYIPFTTNDATNQYTHEAQIAGIDTYYENNYPNVCPHHIDFITRDCYQLNRWTDGGVTYTTVWNETSNNNGTANEQSPWKASYLYNLLNNVMYNYLPSNLRSQIISKDCLTEYRYSDSGILTDSNSWDWDTLGKLWLPTEMEVYGTCVWGTKGYSIGSCIQYPIFANRNKIKHVGRTGSRCTWWLITPRSGSYSDICYVGGYGGTAFYDAATTNRIFIPLCFRL